MKPLTRSPRSIASLASLASLASFLFVGGCLALTTHDGPWPCARTDECEDNLACKGGKCVDPSSCRPFQGDLDCASGTVCVNGTCLAGNCSASSSCEKFVCDTASHTCKTACDAPGDCQRANSTCTDGECVDPECATYVDCKGYLCTSGKCTKSCTADNDCALDYGCALGKCGVRPRYGEACGPSIPDCRQGACKNGICN